jgi:GNAT superfamily N-acetyltransferase
MGVFFAPPLARFQELLVYPEHRGIGIARSLAAEAARLSISSFQALTVVTVSDLTGPANHAYLAAGFRIACRQFGLNWYSEKIWP